MKKSTDPLFVCTILAGINFGFQDEKPATLVVVHCMHVGITNSCTPPAIYKPLAFLW